MGGNILKFARWQAELSEHATFRVAKAHITFDESHHFRLRRDAT